MSRVLKSGSLFLVSVLLLTAGLTACGGSTPGTTASTQSVSPASQTAATGYEIAVFKNSSKVGSITGAQINALTRVSVTVDGKVQEGPTLLSVLALAGITDFTQITVKGMSKGRIALAELTLKRAQVDNTVILDINNRGETKLTGPSIGDNSAIIDVKELRLS